MANIALVCPPLPGHLNPTATLGRALRRRGHSVAYFHIPGVEAKARAAGIDFIPVGSAGSATLAERIREMSKRDGLRSLKFAIDCSRECSELLCEHLPRALVNAGTELVIVDQNEPAGGSVAEHLGLPFVNICPSLPLNREPYIPPPFAGWDYRTGFAARLRNRIGCALTDRMIAPINKTVNAYRAKWGLTPLRKPDDSFSRTAQLCQMTRDFDFPRQDLPDSFHYLGPFFDDHGPAIAFPFERLNGKPLIYASLGTLQQHKSGLFKVIAEACGDLDVQLILSTGGSATALGDLPGSPIVVSYAPQMEILSRAALAITHGGLNTVMQSLSFGVPMVALPITHDQPAIAARVRHSGAGEVIPVNKVNARLLRSSILRVIAEPSYRRRAAVLCESIRMAGGVERAATIVERLLAGTVTSPHAQDAFRNR